MNLRKAPLILAALATAYAQQPQAFEVASVRPHQGEVYRAGPLAVSGPLIRLQGYTIYGLILDAYNLRDFQVSLGPQIRPEDIADVLYDIAARAPGDTIPRLDDVRAMLRTLLETRFGLRVHREPRHMPVLALMSAASSTRLQPAVSGQSCTIRTSLAPDGRNNEEVFTGCPLERLADTLTHLLTDQPVVDRTGLTGQYNFRVVATPAWRARNQPEQADIDPLTAVRSLGLKLKPQKTRVEILVVDHLERPSEN